VCVCVCVRERERERRTRKKEKRMLLSFEFLVSAVSLCAFTRETAREEDLFLTCCSIRVLSHRRACVGACVGACGACVCVCMCARKRGGGDWGASYAHCKSSL